MTRVFYRSRALLIAALPPAFSFLATCSQSPTPPKDQQIRTIVELVTFNVTVQDQETGMPVENLGREDFQVLDDRHLVSAVYFERARSSPTKIWFLVNCPERGGIDSGSRFMAGKSSLLRPALDKLNSDDTVGVAHWCVNGDAKIDLAPTQNREAPLDAIDMILRQTPVEPASPADRLALQRALGLVIDNTRFESKYALPVIVLLYDGRFSIPKDETELMAKKLLYNGAMVYQIGSQSENFTGLDPLAQNSSLQFISTHTGGSVFAVKDDYLKAMDSLVETLHFRYTFGFGPRSRDKQWHELGVQLTEAAQQNHRPFRVHCGAGYLNVGSYWSVPPYSISKYQQATNPQLDPELTRAIESPTVGRDIRFDAKAHSFTRFNATRRVYVAV